MVSVSGGQATVKVLEAEKTKYLGDEKHVIRVFSIRSVPHDSSQERHAKEHGQILPPGETNILKNRVMYAFTLDVPKWPQDDAKLAQGPHIDSTWYNKSMIF